MSTHMSPRPCFRAAQALALVVALCFSLGASNSSARFSSLNHRLMCACGCAELLGECNHVGCQSSSQELDELSAAIDAGKGDKDILSSFSAKYGATVLAAPTTEGFDLLAWIAPFAVFAAALLGTVLLVRRWSAAAPRNSLPPSDLVTEDLRKQIRRETGNNGGV